MHPTHAHTHTHTHTQTTQHTTHTHHTHTTPHHTTHTHTHTHTQTHVQTAYIGLWSCVDMPLLLHITTRWTQSMKHIIPLFCIRDTVL